MTHHLDDTPGLLAAPRTFYSDRLHAERGAFALEWINAFAHVDPQLRRGLTLHGGTLAQLHIGALQRLSRDIDLLGMRSGIIEPVLDAIADRYKQHLFTWAEDVVESPAVPMQRFSVYFPSATTPSTSVPLKLDVTYLPIDLPLATVRLSSSAVYVPTRADDTVETLTPTAFIADKLPTLGFDTLGYPRPTQMAETGNPEHIFKQLHDISALLDLEIDHHELLGLYAAGIDVRNKARNLNYGVDACLADANRVCRVAIAGWSYPNNDDVAYDTNYIMDVQHARAGIQPFRAYALSKTPDVVVSASRVYLLTAALAATRQQVVQASDLRLILERARSIGEQARDPEEKKFRAALSKVFGRAVNPDGWSLPVTSRRIFGAAPDAAVWAYVGRDPAAELASLKATDRFIFEPQPD